MRDEGEDLCEGRFKFKPKRLFNNPIKAAAPFAFSHPSAHAHVLRACVDMSSSGETRPAHI